MARLPGGGGGVTVHGGAMELWGCGTVSAGGVGGGGMGSDLGILRVFSNTKDSVVLCVS